MHSVIDQQLLLIRIYSMCLSTSDCILWWSYYYYHLASQCHAQGQCDSSHSLIISIMVGHGQVFIIIMVK